MFQVYKTVVRESRFGTHHNGYKTVCNQSLKASGDSRFVHRFVLEAFSGPRPDGMEALHLDNDPANNRIGNLRWGTKKENHQQRVRDGRGYRSTRLTARDVKKIRSKQHRAKDLAAEFGLSLEYIYKVRSGKRGSFPKIA